MKPNKFLSLALLLLAGLQAQAARADSTAQTLPFSQDWSNTGLITANDDWSGVPGIVGFRGDGLAATTGTNPQTVLGAGTPVADVNANQTNPATFNTGGVTEYEIVNPTIGLTGSGTGQAPSIVLYLDTTGQSDIEVSYNLRDLEASADNAQQQFALQYRIGSAGDFIDLPAGYVADTTTANAATQVTPVSVTLPAAADNQPLVEVRIITTNAVGNDENVGVDDISVTAGGVSDTPSFSINNVTLGEGNGGTTEFIFTVTLNNPNGSPSGVIVESSDGTASAGSDYSAVGSQTLSFSGSPAGIVQTQTVSVFVNGDLASEPNETFNLTLSGATNADLASATGIGTITNDDLAPASARVYQIQGAGHNSPMVGMPVTNVPGIVTARAGNGFYLQDASGDGNPDTSDGIFVFTSSAPTVTVGQTVAVSGTVAEFRQITSGTACQGSIAAGPCLRLTEITGATVTVTDSGNSLASIAPTVIGSGGRIIPNSAIYTGTTQVSVEDAAYPYDPAVNAIDFFESLEGMRVQVNNSRVVSPTNTFSSGSEFWVVPDDYANSNDLPNASGGLTYTGYDDPQPERVQIDSGIFGSPQQVTVGDSVPGSIVGVIGNSFANYELLYTQPFSVVGGGLQKGVSPFTPGAADKLVIAAYNVENLGGNDAQSRFDTIAGEIVNRLRSPDLISVSEVQDNNGATNDGIVDASTTLNKIIAAVVAAGGPAYEFRQIDPADDQDGGEPGGNIRVAFLFNPARLTFVGGTVGAGDAATATAVTAAGGQLALTLSPGRIAPANAAWNSSRKPLAATFDFNGRRIVVVGNHFNSKGGDDQSFGRLQPPGRSSETQRHSQAQLVYDFVAGVLTTAPKTAVVVLGDLNDFGFSESLNLLRSGNIDPTLGVERLHNLGEELVDPPRERHSYVFQGVSQELDHILVDALRLPSAQFSAVRFNSEFSDQTSDHDPLIAELTLMPNQGPLADAGADQTVVGGAAATLSGTGSSDGDGDIVGLQWTQTAGTAVTLSGADTATASFTAPDAAGTLSFTLSVTDDEGATATDSVDVTVAADITPDPFAFTDLGEVTPGTAVLSDPITVTGINSAAPVSVTGGYYSLNGEATCLRTSGSVVASDQIRVCHSASADFGTTVETTLTIGADGVLAGISDTFTSTTQAAPADTTPDAFQFQDRTLLLPLPARYTSNVITISGINAPAPISVSGRAEPMYSVNGGPFRSTAATVNNGDRVQLRTRYPAFDFRPPYLTTDTTLTVGGVSDTWTVKLRLLW